MKRPWEPVTLTRLWWEGPDPEPGDALETTTGRRYLILSIRGRRLDCLVLPRGEPVHGRVYAWRWAARSRSRPQKPSGTRCRDSSDEVSRFK